MSLFAIILCVVLLVVLLLIASLSGSIGKIYHRIRSENEAENTEEFEESLSFAKTLSNTARALIILVIPLTFYFVLKDTIYLGHYQEWLNMIVRWFHITIGIAWIGASFYFVFLENSLNRTKDLRDELAGNLWAVHGGGFYYVEKYKIAPKVIPRELHWFKYEAYFTWMSGIALLFIVYYFQAESMMVDKTVFDIHPYAAVAIGLISLAMGWIIYDWMCSTSLLHKPMWFGIVGFILLMCFAYGYTLIFSARAAYIHFGALMGTMMVGNVFFGIIPAQKAMVKAAKNGTALDPRLGKLAGLRSYHNNYFTLPVLFVMISNHFPSTFGHEQPWLILGMLTLGSAGVKHYLNLNEKGQESVFVMPIAVLILLGAVFISAPENPTGNCDDEVSFAAVYNVMQTRCVQCHSASPTDKTYTSPPNGVKYDTADEIKVMSEKIMQRVVITKTMPQNNITGMLPEERELIRCWINQGSNINAGVVAPINTSSASTTSAKHEH